MNLREMRDALYGEPKADEAIFWFAYSWHAGKGSDLYNVLRELDFTPTTKRKFADDYDIIRMFDILENVFGPFVEVPHRPVYLADIEPDDIIVAGANHRCLPNRWPVKVFPSGTSLAVMCNDGIHPLHASKDGIVEGFRR
jgi:hypothetical protein